MKIKDIMTDNIAYLTPNSTIQEAARLMQQHNIGALPVCDDEGIKGIVTDRDIVVRNIAHGNDPATTTVDKVMTGGITAVTPETDIDEVAEIMSMKQVRRIPVVENDELVGMVSLGDLATRPDYFMEASDALTEISCPSKPENLKH